MINIPEKILKCLLISDFNIDIFGAYLTNDASGPKVQTTSAPFGQVMPTLLDQSNAMWLEQDCALVWTQPQQVVDAFARVMNFETVSEEEVLDQVDAYCQALLTASKNVSTVFVPTWVLPTHFKGRGMIDHKRQGVALTLAKMNVRLAENLAQASNVFVLSANQWIETTTKPAFNDKLWYMGKIPFDHEVFKIAVKDVKSALAGIQGLSKKLIVLDLDDTLWGGIVGDVGWQNLRLGGHDPFGESFVDFQKALKALKNRGIILAVVSKNEESVALEAIENHPEMILRKEDFATWRINWEDKAKNIAEIVTELNLGLQSVVFIDDNPVERARVQEALPEVLVPEWPKDQLAYKNALFQLDCFNSPVVSDEDAKRAQMYAVERQRQEVKTDVGSIEDWLKTLDVTITIETLNDSNIQRTAQLLNKTNQMNLSTRRMTESELTDWANATNNQLWSFRVKDKFGDSGLTGIASVECSDETAVITDFVLSCRVFGRRIEDAMLFQILKHAKAKGIKQVSAKYLPTPKNKPTLQFLQRAAHDHQDNEIFTWTLNDELQPPEAIKLIDEQKEEVASK